MNPKSKEFKKLQDKWYGKLEKSGFVDLEQADGNLKSWSSGAYRDYEDPNLRESKEEYYRLAGQFLHSFKFESKRERTIWEFHSRGVSIRDIVGLLARRNIRTCRFTVHQVLQKLKKELLKGTYHE